MSPQNAERRPVVDGTATVEQELGGSLTIVPPVTDDDQTHGVRATTLMIQFETSEGRHTRRPYRSLTAAERAVRAAHRRGVSVRLLLCDLVEIRELTVEFAEAAR